MTPDAHPRDDATPLEEVGRGVVNLFTVERDTRLADGAGAPGSTSVGGMRRDEDADESSAATDERDDQA